MDCNLPGSSAHVDSPGKKAGVGCYALLQGIFLTQGSNVHFLFSTLVGWFFTTNVTCEALQAALETPKVGQKRLVILISLMQQIFIEHLLWAKQWRYKDMKDGGINIP